MYSILVLRLFTFPRTPAELSAGVGREWPDARGAFVMDSARPEIGQRMTGFCWLFVWTLVWVSKMKEILCTKAMHGC